MPGASRVILSIAVPSFNVERYLEKGLQTLNDTRFAGRLEVIVVNDGSTDSTESIAGRFVDDSPEIFKIVSKENGGHGSAVNAGIEHARGKYFRVVDADDWVDADELLSMLDFLDTCDADIVVDVRTDVDMASGEETVRAIDVPFPFDEALPFSEVCTDYAAADTISIHTLTVKTEDLKEQKIELLEKTFYEDYEYIVKATAAAETIAFKDLKVYHYLLGNASQSVSDANYAKRWDDHTRVTNEVLRFVSEAFEDEDVPVEIKRYLVNRAILLINTHYNIALIFDADRKRGVVRAKEFREFLKAEYPAFVKATDNRYHQARLLHFFGVDSQEKLDRITGRK